MTGRPRYEPTDEQRAAVKALKSFGVRLDEIASYIGCDRKTLSKYFAREIETAQTEANMNVSEFLYHAATGKAMQDGAQYADCLRAAMFWAKTRAGYSEKNALDVTSSDGSMSPKVVERIIVDPSDSNA
jgi:hypothetical protein